MLQSLQRQVRADEWGPGESGDNIADYHIRPVLVRGINPPPDGPLPCHQPNAALSSPGAGWPCRQIGHVLAEAIVQIRLQLYLCLGYQHHVKAPALHHPYDMRQTESPAIPDV